MSYSAILAGFRRHAFHGGVTLDSPFQPHGGIPTLNSTLFDINQSDVTGRVNMASPGAVADAICAVLGRRFADFDEIVLRQGFIDIEDIFWGRYPGYLHCDTPYHDLRHSMSTALAMARMVDGYEATHGGEIPALGAELATLGLPGGLVNGYAHRRPGLQALMA